MDRVLQGETVAETQRHRAEVRLAGDAVFEGRILETSLEKHATRTHVELTTEQSGKTKFRVPLAVFQAKRGPRRTQQKELRLHTDIRMDPFVREQAVRNGQTNRHAFFHEIPRILAVVRGNARRCRAAARNRSFPLGRVTLISAA